MSLQPLVPALIALLALSSGAMTWSAWQRSEIGSMIAAAVYSAAVLAAAWWINRPLLAKGPPNQTSPSIEPLIHASRRNARLMALTYAWGSLALLAVYKLSGLKWQHGWQYGSAMAVVAGALLLYVHKLGDPKTPLRSLTSLDATSYAALAQAIAAAGGLVFLVTSGKLWSGKQDWAANHVFIAGGLAIAGISLLAFLVHRRLRPS